MAAIVISGKKIANNIKRSVKRDLKKIRRGRRNVLKLAVLRIGRSPSSKIYLSAQKSLAEELGIKHYVKTLGAGVSQQAAEREITRLNGSRSVTGIMVHTPTPRHIDMEKLLAGISPAKDAEGLNPANIGRLIYGKRLISPCTASACMALIEATGIRLRGKEAVIIGHSEIVGKPLSLMLLSEMATTTVCHIGTYERVRLKEHIRRAEVLVVSVGKSRFIKGGWIKKGAVVIDVGINRHKGKVTGDVDFNAAKRKASYITPVPGGVGPLTTVMLMKNLVSLHRISRGIRR